MGMSLENAWIGVLLTAGAGLATALGASAVFFTACVKLASRRTLAGGLGLASGVMLYISFTEIYAEAVEGYAEHYHQWVALEDAYVSKTFLKAADYHDQLASLYAGLTFFAGIALMMALDKVVHRLTGDDGHKGDDGIIGAGPHPHLEASPRRLFALQKTKELNKTNKPMDDNRCVVSPQEAKDPIHSEAIGKKFGDTKRDVFSPTASNIVVASKVGIEDGHCDSCNVRNLEFTLEVVEGMQEKLNASASASAKALDQLEKGAQAGQPDSDIVVLDNQKDRKLALMGLKTALAIAIHNFPEGLATFVATLDSVEVGISMAFGIAIHNIPEGLCVAIPIYYATGNRWKAFLWGVLSGVSEPVGALICWAILGETGVDGVTYGLLFGLVGGMMVYICLHELLPTAHRYDPKDTVVTNAALLGMGIMFCSLQL